jgi:hypothetical protein
MLTLYDAGGVPLPAGLPVVDWAVADAAPVVPDVVVVNSGICAVF